MTTRRALFAAAAMMAASATAVRRAVAQSAPAPAPGASPETADFLFVQTAKRMSFDRGRSKLTLHDVSPVTILFTDRPERVAANMRTAVFVPFWSAGRNSFLSDPPNADVSVVEGDQLREAVVVLRDPALQGANLSYTVRVLEGQMPLRGSDASVFIDVIGMPLTPLSFAGARRRMYRRAYYRWR